MRECLDVGVTGTRWGMTDAQKSWVVDFLADNRIGALRHGCCRGSDQQFVGFAWELSIGNIHAYPPLNDAFTFLNWRELSSVVHARRDYLERNRNIVLDSGVVLATPAEMKEVTRSGTWATIRYARQLERELYVVLPDGTLL